MTGTATPLNIVQVQDVTGRFYDIDHDTLIKTAQRCIGERFSKGQAMTSSETSKDYINVLLGHYEHEVFYALWLDNRHHIIDHQELFRGTIDAAAVYPREVVKAALACNAAAVIFAHNHPSGDTRPSVADRAITRRLKDALALLDIRVLDHLVVGSDVSSMAELGML